MLTSELRSQVDAIWSAVWTGGTSNPMEVIEQITYQLAGVARNLLADESLDAGECLAGHSSPCGRLTGGRSGPRSRSLLRISN